MTRLLAALALLVPLTALAQAAPASPPAAVPAATAPEAPAPAGETAAPAKDPAQVAAPAAATPAAAPVAQAPKKQYGSYLVLKGGWFGSADDYQGDSFGGAGEWELAVGTGRVLGIELGSGSMTTSAGPLEVRTIPLLLTLRLGIPLAIVLPHVDLGAGLYFNRATLGSLEVNDATAGWHVGVGCDVLLGRLLLGADARYMGIAPTFSTVGTLTLDRYAFLLKAGVRF